MENLTKKEKKEKLEKYKRETLLRVFNTREDLYKWIQLFVGWKLVLGWVDRESNSSPIDAIWEVYKAVKNNTGDVTPGFILLSSRSSYKTLSVSVLEVLLMLHFRTSIAHMAAIKPQSQKAISYITSLLRKLKPYLDFHKWEAVSESVSMIKYETPDGESPYIKVVVCTMAGANCIAGNSIVHKLDGTSKLAIDVEVGEKILTWDYINQKDVEVEVGGIGVTGKQAFEIRFKDGSNLVCSDDHPVFSQCGWRFAETLRVGALTKRRGTCPINTSAPTSIEVVNHDLEQLIYGTVLGDAYLDKIPSGKVRYTVFHSHQQVEYLKKIQSIFEKNNIQTRLTPDRGGYKLQTLTYPFLEKYHNEFYKEKTKVVTREILNKLTMEGVSFWSMDDSTCHSTVKNRYKDHCISFATCCFTREENLIICDFFKEKGFNARIGKTKSKSGKYDVVELDLASSRRLSQEMSPWFSRDLRYKLLPRRELHNTYYNLLTEEKTVKERQSFNRFVGTRKQMNGRLYRETKVRISKDLDNAISEIIPLGKLNLVDIHIKTDIPNLRSFYANNTLVHNSDHTNIMCIEENQTVLTNHGDIKIRRLFDLVNNKNKIVYAKSINIQTGEYEFKQILAVHDNGTRECFEVECNDGKTICTDDHKFLTPDGYKKLKDLDVGSGIWVYKKINGGDYHSLSIITKIEPIGLKEVYDTTVEDNHNMIVSGCFYTHQCFDEIDVVSNPAALEEAKMIPDVENGRFPITVKLSTRKFAFGLMNEEIERAPITGDKILRWNLMDTAERCDESRHKPELPRQTFYVARNLPLQTLTEDEFSRIEQLRQPDYQQIEAWVGCYECKLLPVCKTELSKRGKECSGSFYKPITSILNSFKKVTPDVAEAQLLCWRPSTKGLVYPRFDEISNSISTTQAYNQITGENHTNISFDVLAQLIKKMEYPVFCSVDWGSTNASAFIVGVVIPNGDFWILDCYAQTDLELDDLVAKGLELQELYNIQKFYVDQAYPAYIKTFQKKGMRCPKFTKDVMGGIQITRGQICDSLGRRRLKIVQTNNNKAMINMFKTHHFLLNAQGELTDNPDNTKETADLADSLRYMCQNLFSPKGGGTLISKDLVAKPVDLSPHERQQALHNSQFQQELKSLRDDTQPAENTRKSKGGLFWSM